MKYYIPPFMVRTSNVDEILSSIGIEYTTDINDIDITNSLSIKIPEFVIPCSNIHDVEQVVDTFGMNSANYINNKLNIDCNHNLNNKLELNNTLETLGLAHLPILYPTTEQQLKDFFIENGSLFCKPLIGSGSNIPTDISKHFRMFNEEVDIYIESIQIPTDPSYMYKEYTSFSEFESNVDLVEFFEIQINSQTPDTHKVIFQKTFIVDEHWTHFLIPAFVNGTGEVIHEAYMTGKKFVQDLTDKPINANSNWDSTQYNEDEIITVINSRVKQGEDPYNMDQKLANIVNHVGCKNTIFTAQGYISDTGEVIFFDFSTGRGIQVFKRSWITQKQNQARFNFMNDLPYIKEDTVVDTCRFWFEIYIEGGASIEQLKLAKTLDIDFMSSVKAGLDRFPCTAYGTDPIQIAKNVRTYLDLFKPVDD